MIKIESNLAVSAFFEIEKFNSHNEITYSGKPFENMVLDSAKLGLFTYTLSQYSAYLNLGSDNTVPDGSQTRLLARTYSTNNIFNSQSTQGLNYFDPYYIFIKKTFQFNIGTCTGTHREIGLSVSNNSNYFNRQLIKDGNGDPMDLVVAADEGLRITVEIRLTTDQSKLFAQIYKLDLKGATAGSIVFQSGAGTKTITLAAMIAQQDYHVEGNLRTYPLTGNYSLQTNLDDIIPEIVHCHTDVDGKILIFIKHGRFESIPLTIQSHTLTGGSGSPEITERQAFLPPVVKTHDHLDETTGQTTQLSYYIFPIIFTSSTVLGGFGNGWSSGYNWNYSMKTMDMGLGLVGAGAATSGSVISEPTTNNLIKEKQSYWAPGKLGSGTIVFDSFTLGSLYNLKFLTPFSVVDTEEFYFNYSIQLP